MVRRIPLFVFRTPLVSGRRRQFSLIDCLKDGYKTRCSIFYIRLQKHLYLMVGVCLLSLMRAPASACSTNALRGSYLHSHQAVAPPCMTHVLSRAGAWEYIEAASPCGSPMSTPLLLQFKGASMQNGASQARTAESAARPPAVGLPRGNVSAVKGEPLAGAAPPSPTGLTEGDHPLGALGGPVSAETVAGGPSADERAVREGRSGGFSLPAPAKTAELGALSLDLNTPVAPDGANALVDALLADEALDGSAHALEAETSMCGASGQGEGSEARERGASYGEASVTASGGKASVCGETDQGRSLGSGGASSGEASSAGSVQPSRCEDSNGPPAAPCSGVQRWGVTGSASRMPGSKGLVGASAGGIRGSAVDEPGGASATQPLGIASEGAGVGSSAAGRGGAGRAGHGNGPAIWQQADPDKPASSGGDNARGGDDCPAAEASGTAAVKRPGNGTLTPEQTDPSSNPASSCDAADASSSLMAERQGLDSQESDDDTAVTAGGRGSGGSPGVGVLTAVQQAAEKQYRVCRAPTVLTVRLSLQGPSCTASLCDLRRTEARPVVKTFKAEQELAVCCHARPGRLNSKACTGTGLCRGAKIPHLDSHTCWRQVHLKRFQQNARGRLRKIGGAVAFPLHLDMGPFCEVLPCFTRPILRMCLMLIENSSVL